MAEEEIFVQGTSTRKPEVIEKLEDYAEACGLPILWSSFDCFEKAIKALVDIAARRKLQIEGLQLQQAERNSETFRWDVGANMYSPQQEDVRELFKFLTEV